MLLTGRFPAFQSKVFTEIPPRVFLRTAGVCVYLFAGPFHVIHMAGTRKDFSCRNGFFLVGTHFAATFGRGQNRHGSCQMMQVYVSFSCKWRSLFLRGCENSQFGLIPELAGKEEGLQTG